jgi:uncharacterized protein YoxC
MSKKRVSVRQAEIEKKKQGELWQAQLEKKQEDNKGSGKKHKSRTTADAEAREREASRIRSFLLRLSRETNSVVYGLDGVKVTSSTPIIEDTLEGGHLAPPGAPSVQLQHSQSVTPAHPKEMVAATVQEELVRLRNRHQASEGTIGQLYGEVHIALREAERVQGLDETLKAVCEQQEELSTEVKALEQAMEEAAKTTQELQKSTAKSLAETVGRFKVQASRLKQQGNHFNSLGREQEKLSQRVSEVERRLGSTEPLSEVQEGWGIIAESSARSQGVEESIAKGEALGDGAGETIGRLQVTVEETAMKVTEFGQRLEGIRSMVEEVSSKTKQEIEESIAECIGEHIDAKGDTGLDTVQDMINNVELSLSSEMSKRLDELNQRVDNIQAQISVVQEEAKDFRAEVLSSLDCIFNAITQPPPSPMHDTSSLTPRRAGFIRIPARAGTSAVAIGAGASASAPVPAPIGSVSAAPVPEPVRSGGQMGVAGPSTGRPKVQVVTTGRELVISGFRMR